MSHFYTMVLVPKEFELRSREDIKGEVGRLLAPYDESLEVPEHDKKCYCVGVQARNESKAAAAKKFGNIESHRIKFGKLNGAEQTRINKILFSNPGEYTEEEVKAAQAAEKKINAAWQKFIKPYVDYSAKQLAKHKLRDKAKKDCDECKGTGLRKTTYSPDSKWDWWVIGGRWTGSLVPGYDPTKEPENKESCFICGGTGRRDDALGLQARKENPAYTCNGCGGTGKTVKFRLKDFGGDIMRVKDLPPDDRIIPFAIVTPDGKWNEKGEMGWWGMTSNEKEQEDWNEIVKALLKKHADCLACVADLHI